MASAHLAWYLWAAAGDDVEYARIERLTAASDVPVTLAGRLDGDGLVRAYRSSDVFVLPSFYEGLPLVTIEALACGCKVVATDLPGVRPWMEAMLPGAPVTWVASPRMTDVDTPVAADLPLFERALAELSRSACGAVFDVRVVGGLLGSVPGAYT